MKKKEILTAEGPLRHYVDRIVKKKIEAAICDDRNGVI